MGSRCCCPHCCCCPCSVCCCSCCLRCCPCCLRCCSCCLCCCSHCPCCCFRCLRCCPCCPWIRPLLNLTTILAMFQSKTQDNQYLHSDHIGHTCQFVSL